MSKRITVAGLIPGVSTEEIRDRAFSLLKKIRTVSLATINGGKPAVRFVHLSAIRDGKLYFLAPRDQCTTRSEITPLSPYQA
jgi:hypothetical protein